MGKTLQEIAEEKVFDILFELEDELEIGPVKLPEIYYVKKSSKFEEYALPESCREDFNYVKKFRTGIVSPKNNIVFVGTLDREVLGEEIGHYIHYLNASPKTNDVISKFYFGAITEMIGFFAGKLTAPERKNDFDASLDILTSCKTSDQELEIIIQEYNKGFTAMENLIYSQGYSLGQKLYDYYVTGFIPIEKIQELIKNPLNSDFEKMYYFNHWKNKVLNLDDGFKGNIQKNLESRVKEISKELEFKLEINSSVDPKVYYVDNDLTFIDESIIRDYPQKIKELISTEGASFLFEDGIILTSTLDKGLLAEEIGHFIHTQHTSPSKEKKGDEFAFEVLSEMLGYFSSKLIDPLRQNPLKENEDIFPEDGDQKEFAFSLNFSTDLSGKEYSEQVHTQGYSMGEMLFNQYKMGNINIDTIKQLIKDPLSDKFDAINNFYDWKYNILK